MSADSASGSGLGPLSRLLRSAAASVRRGLRSGISRAAPGVERLRGPTATTTGHRMAERLRGPTATTTGHRMAELEAAVAELQAAVAENRRLSFRVAELTDLVAETLLPAGRRDEQRLQDALERFLRES